MWRAFRLLHSTYIHPYVESMKLTRTSKLDAMKSGSSLQVIILALPKMVQLQRLAIDVACPAELYIYIHDSKQIKQLVFTKLASKTNNLGRAQCRLEALELFDMGRKELIPTGLIMQSASSLKSLSVHSRGYIYAFWGFTQPAIFFRLTSFTFSSTDQDIAPHILRDILELCPSITALHLPTFLLYAFLLPPDALPKLNTLNAGPNEFVLRFVEGRPVRRLFATPIPFFSVPSGRQPLQNCSFSLLHLEIEYSYADAFFNDLNRTLIYCEDLALVVWIGAGTVRHFLTLAVSISHLTLIKPSDGVVTTLIMWLTAPSLVDLSLTIRARGYYVWGALDMEELRRHFEIRLRNACGGSPNLQQLKVEYRLNTWTEHGFHARRLRDGEWVVRSSLGGNTVTSWYHTETELAETEEG